MPRKKKEIPYDDLYMEYVVKHRTIADLSKYFAVSDETLIRILKRNNIQLRNKHETFNLQRSYFDILNNKQFLIEEYINKNRSVKSIACDLKCSKYVIYSYLKKNDIKRKSKIEQTCNIKNIDVKFFLSKDFLEKEYCLNKRTLQDIANELGVNKKTILNYIKKFNLKTRKNGEHQYGNNSKVKTLLLNRQFLEDQYIKLGKTAKIIADELHIDKSTVLVHLEKCNIKRRSHLEYEYGRSKVHMFKLIPLLEKYGISHKTSHILYYENRSVYEIDEYLNDLKIFIELQGLYWHGYIEKNDISAKKERFDILKYRHIQEHLQDHKVVYILESDFNDGLAEDIIKNINVKKNYTYWKPAGYIVNKVEHINNESLNINYEFTAIKDNKSIAIAIFSKTDLVRKYDNNALELLSYSSFEHGTNFNSWFISQCLKKLCQRPIITFVDIRREVGKRPNTGVIFKAANFKEFGLTEKDYCYLTYNNKILSKEEVRLRANLNKVAEKYQAQKEDLTIYYIWPKKVFIYK